MAEPFLPNRTTTYSDIIGDLEDIIGPIRVQLEGIKAQRPATDFLKLPTFPEVQQPFHPSFGGFIKNIAGDFVEMAKGITGILGAAAEPLSPEYWMRRYFSDAPVQDFKLTTIIKNLGLVVDDYKRRYGSFGGFVRGLYEDPIFFISDIFLIGGIFSGMAKAGRVGGVLSKLPKIVSDKTAERILGPAQSRFFGFSPIAARQPFYSSMRSVDAAEAFGLPVSANPVVRAIQMNLYKAISVPVETFVQKYANTARTMQMVEAYKKLDSGARILRPWVERTRILPATFDVGNYALKLLSKMRVHKNDLERKALAELEQIIPGADPDAANVVDVLHGLAAPVDTPRPEPIIIQHTKFEELDPFQGQPLPGDIDINVLKAVTEKYAKDNIRVLGDANMRSYMAPHSLVDRNAMPNTLATGANRFQIILNDIRLADDEVASLFDELGIEPVGVVDYLKEPAIAWDGVYYYGRLPDGRMIEISVMTPEMAVTQRAAQYLIEDRAAVREAYEANLEEIRVLKEERAEFEMQDEIDAVKEANREIRRLAHENQIYLQEMYAIDQLSNALFDWSKLKMSGVTMDPAYEKALRLRPWVYENVIRRWVHSRKMKYRDPYSRMMERAYGPQRATLFYTQMIGLENKVYEFLRRPEPKNLVDLLEFFTEGLELPDEIVIEILGANKRDIVTKLVKLMKADAPPAELDKLAADVAKTFRQNWRTVMWKPLVEEGGGASALHYPVKRSLTMPDGTSRQVTIPQKIFLDYDWRLMHLKRKMEGVPTPIYYPHIPSSPLISQALLRSPRSAAQRIVEPDIPEIMQKWRGLRFEAGVIQTDVFEAYQRAARIMINHEEVLDLVDEMISTYGRPVTPYDLAIYRQYGPNAFEDEVFISRERVDDLLTIRSRIEEDIVTDVAEGRQLFDAALEAIQEANEEALKAGISELTSGKIYAIPKAVYRALQTEVRHALGSPVLLAYDGLMNFWKSMVLIGPRWLLNNLMGNLSFIFLERPGAIRYALSQMDATNRGLISSIMPEVVNEVERGFFRGLIPESSIGRGAYTDVPILQQISDIARGRGEIGRFNFVGRSMSRLADKVRMLQSHIEEAARRGVLLDAAAQLKLQNWVKGFHSTEQILKKIAKEGLSEAEMNMALKMVDRTLGNYMLYTPFEQAVLRRFLTPFWGFTRHVIKVAALMPIEHPLKANVLRLVNKLNEQMEEEYPDFLKNQAAIHIGELGGRDTWLRLKNFNPLSIIHEDAPLVSMMSPGFKLLVERYIAQKDVFTGETFTPPENMVQLHDGSWWELQLTGSGFPIGIVKSGPPLPPLVAHLIQQFGPLEMIPPFRRYKRSFTQAFMSWVGLPTTSISPLYFPTDPFREALSRYQSRQYRQFVEEGL